MLKKSFFLFFVFILCADVPMCSAYFQKLPEYDGHTSCLEIKGKMSVQAQYFSRQDSINYFKKDLIDMGVRPVVITLFNTSTKGDYLFKKEYFQLPLVSTRKIIRAFSFGSSLYVSSLLLSAFRTRTISSISLAALAGAVYHNKEVEAGLELNRLQKNRVYKLAPYNQITFLLFVEEKKFTPQFDLYYFDTATQKTEKVSVDLLKNIRNGDFLVPDVCIFD